MVRQLITQAAPGAAVGRGAVRAGPTGARARVELAVRQGRGAVIVGEAGIGKSYMARSVTRRLEARGVTVELVLATQAASSVPFGALAGLIEPAAARRSDLLEVLHATGDRLAARARRGGLVVVVDDAHWLDPASSALLLALVTRHHVRVLATVRAATPTPDAVKALWKDAGLVRVDLEPLGQHETTEMAVRLLGGPVERATRRWLWQTSAGNPLFLGELVHSGLERGALALERGHWRRVASVPPTERLLDLLDERIDAFTAAERRALALVALSEPASLELLARLDALDAARSLEARGLLAAAPAVAGASLRVGHPLYGEALRASLRVTEARELHRELAQQLDPTDTGNRLRLVAWAMEDGQRLDASDLSEAAEAALAAFDPELAVRLGRAALDAGGALDATLTLASALRAVGRFEEAERHLIAVESEARRRPRMTTYLFLRVGNAWALGDPAQAHGLLAREDLARDSEAVAAALYSYEGRHREAVSSAQHVLTTDSTDGQATAIAAIAGGYGLAVLGQPGGALELLDRAQRIAAGVESEWPLEAIAVLAAFYAGEQWADRRASLAERYATARADGDEARAALCELALARLAIPAGDLRDATRFAQDALSRLSFMDPRVLAPACHAMVAAARATAGDAEAATSAWQTGALLLGDGPPNPLARTLLERAEVLVHACHGDPKRAQQTALERAQAAGEAVMVEGEMLHLYLRVGGSPKRVARRLEQIAAATRAHMAQLWARQATGARAGDAIELEAVARDYEDVGARIYAAEAAAEAAIAHDSAGNRDASRRAQARAARLATSCGAAGLTLVSTMRMSGLTAREQQVARLVALGLSNAQIAERLSLSVRTVESHVYRATTKLGVRDRTRLAALLGTPRIASGT